MRPAHDDADVVPLARAMHDALGRGVQPVVGARRREPVAAVGVPRIVEHLELGAAGVHRLALLGQVVHDAAVAAGGDAPLEPELEVLELVHGDDVAGRALLHQRAVRGLPALRQRGHPIAAPPVRRAAARMRAPRGSRRRAPRTPRRRRPRCAAGAPAASAAPTAGTSSCRASEPRR